MGHQVKCIYFKVRAFKSHERTSIGQFPSTIPVYRSIKPIS